MSKIGVTRISRRCFYKCGGFSNPRMYRCQISGQWAYFHIN